MREMLKLSEVLYIDLGNWEYWIEERSELFEECLGGAGVGIRLLKKECPKGAEPLGPDNPIILSIGYLNGIFPLASKTVAMFKSPLTENLGESHAGGRCGVALRMAGYGAIVIKSRSESPVYLVINEEGVKIRDASALWGMSSSYTVGRIIRENEGAPGLRAIMRIGRAGERLVSYACVTTETYRHFGRLGLGAVFGSKRLKAVMVSGKKSFKLDGPKDYRGLYNELFETFTKSQLMKKYHEIGTSMNVLPLNEIKALPSKNLQVSQFEGAEALSGERLAKNFLGRRAACAHCPVSCIHIAALRERYNSKPYFYKTMMISYDYEPIYALGAMLDIRSSEGFLRLMDKAETLGLDAMSTGVVLSWATEAMQRGLVTTNETEGLDLKWGDYRSYIAAIDRIVAQKNEFYKALAKGAEHASSLYGGQEFALTFGGNEIPGYHTGPAAYLGYLVGARHSHLDGAGYSIDLKMASCGKKPTPSEIADALLQEENWRQILSSLVVCYFARNVYTPETVSRCLKVIGKEITQDELRKKGEQILKEKFFFKFREGFSFDNLRIPKRITETPTPKGAITEDDLREGVKTFEKLIRKATES